MKLIPMKLKDLTNETFIEIEEELEETTTSSATPGYNSKNAFKKRVKQKPIMERSSIPMYYDGEGNLKKSDKIDDIDAAIDRYKWLIDQEKSNLKRSKDNNYSDKRTLYSYQDAVKELKVILKKRKKNKNAFKKPVKQKPILDSVNEAQALDIKAARKDIVNFNRGNINIDQLGRSVVKNLGYKPTKRNVENTIDHLSASADGNEIPTDSTIVKELYRILKESKLNEAKKPILDSVNEAINLKGKTLKQLHDIRKRHWAKFTPGKRKDGTWGDRGKMTDKDRDFLKLVDFEINKLSGHLHKDVKAYMEKNPGWMPRTAGDLDRFKRVSESRKVQKAK